MIVGSCEVLGEKMKLFLALLVWSQGIYPSSSAAAATASASEVKGTAADEKARQAVHGTMPMRAAAVGETIRMPSDLSGMIAEYAHEEAEIPSEIIEALFNESSQNTLPLVYRWLAADPNNINAIDTWSNAGYNPSLIFDVIAAYNLVDSVKIAPLLQHVLSLNPNVRYRPRYHPTEQYRTVLTAMCSVTPKVEDDASREQQLDFVKQIIDLLLEQGEDIADIEKELRALLAYKEEIYKKLVAKRRPHAMVKRDTYSEDLISAALKYVQGIQAAPGMVQREMTTHLGIPEVAAVSVEYLPAAPKKNKHHKHHRREAKHDGA